MGVPLKTENKSALVDEPLKVCKKISSNVKDTSVLSENLTFSPEWRDKVQKTIT